MCLIHTTDTLFWGMVLYFLIGILVTMAIQDTAKEVPGSKKIKTPLALIFMLVWPAIIMGAVITIFRNK